MGVFKRGKIWWLRWTDSDGVEHRESSQSTVKAEAAKMLDELRVREARIAHGLEARNKNPEGLTMATLAARWVAGPGQRQARARGVELLLARAVGVGDFSRLRIERVTGGIIATRLEALKRKDGAPLAARTVNQIRAVFSSIFSWAIETHLLVGENPLKSVKKRRIADHIVDVLSRSELDRLLGALESPWREIAACAALAGLRKGELFALRIDDVDFTNMSIRVARSHANETTKGKRIRYVPMLPELRPHLAQAILTARGAGSQMVFPGVDGKRRHEHTKTVQRLEAGFRRAKIGRVLTLHELRHTFCSLAFEANVPALVIKEVMGHASIQTTMKYAHLRASTAQHALMAMSTAECADGVRKSMESMQPMQSKEYSTQSNTQEHKGKQRNA